MQISAADLEQSVRKLAQSVLRQLSQRLVRPQRVRRVRPARRRDILSEEQARGRPSALAGGRPEQGLRLLHAERAIGRLGLSHEDAGRNPHKLRSEEADARHAPVRRPLSGALASDSCEGTRRRRAGTGTATGGAASGGDARRADAERELAGAAPGSQIFDQTGFEGESSPARRRSDRLFQLGGDVVAEADA